MTHIKDNYYLDADERQFILKEHKGENKEGEQLYNTLGYFRYPQEALETMVNNYIRKDIKKGAELKEIADRMKELKQFFADKFNQI